MLGIWEHAELPLRSLLKHVIKMKFGFQVLREMKLKF